MGLSFPACQPLSKLLFCLPFPSACCCHSRLLCFHAQLPGLDLSGPFPALFLLRDLLQMHPWQCSATQSKAKVSLQLQSLAAAIGTAKVGRGQLAESTDRAARDSHRNSSQPAGRPLPSCPATHGLRLLLACSHRGFPCSLPSGRAASWGDKQRGGQRHGSSHPRAADRDTELQRPRRILFISICIPQHRLSWNLPGL